MHFFISFWCIAKGGQDRQQTKPYYIFTQNTTVILLHSYLPLYPFRDDNFLKKKLKGKSFHSHFFFPGIFSFFRQLNLSSFLLYFFLQGRQDHPSGVRSGTERYDHHRPPGKKEKVNLSTRKKRVNRPNKHGKIPCNPMRALKHNRTRGFNSCEHHCNCDWELAPFLYFHTFFCDALFQSFYVVFAGGPSSRSSLPTSSS